MDAAVIELDALADAVRAAAQDHDLLAVTYRAGIGRIVSGVVIRAVLRGADVHTFPGLGDPQRDTVVTNSGLFKAQKLGQITIGEAILLSLRERIGPRQLARMRGGESEQRLFLLHQFGHLLDEVRLDAGQLVKLLDRNPLAQGLVHDELALTGRLSKEREKLFGRLLVEILREAQAVTAGFKRTNGLLEGFLVRFADGHHFAHSTHLGAQPVFDALELLESPTGELQHDVVTVGNVLVERAVFAARDLVERQTAGEHSGDEGDRETGRLGGKRRGARRARVDLNDDVAISLRIVRPLHVAATDDLNGLHDLVGLFLEALLHLFGNGQHRGRAEGIARVDAQRIDVLNEADRDHVVVRIAHDLELKLLPTEDALFDEDLMNRRCRQAARHDRAKLLDVVDQAAARTAHRVGRTKNTRIAQAIGDVDGIFNRISDFATGHFDTEGVHGLFEGIAVFAALDGVNLNADDLHAVLVEDTLTRQIGAQVKARLTTQVGKKRIGALLGDDALDALDVERLDIDRICRIRIGHDGRGIRVDQNDLIPKATKGLAGLGPGIVEFASLADDDGARSDDEDFLDIGSLCHDCMPLAFGFLR